MLSPATRYGRAALLLAVFVAACESPVGLPSGATRYAPPDVYRTWWQLTESCSGLTGEFGAVRWYRVAAVDSFDLEGTWASGAWYPTGNRIVIAQQEITDGEVVRHEMLHALRQVGGHPRDLFLDKCGGVVACDGGCVQDAGGPPDTSTTAPFVSLADISVKTVVVPNIVSPSRDSGWFSVMVTATSSAARPVRVAVPTRRPWVAFTFSGMGGGEAMWNGDTAVAFAPAGTAGATRRYVFDIRPTVPGLVALPPGSYSVNGVFAQRLASPVALTVSP
jgi:hypothetical protein